MYFLNTSCEYLFFAVYWLKVANRPNGFLAGDMYKLLFKLHTSDTIKSSWTACIQQSVNELGLPNIWLNQGYNVNPAWLKNHVKLRISDQYRQQWNCELDKSASCINYRLFKCSLNYENYLNMLTLQLRVSMTKFRCRNTKLPVVTGAYCNTPYNERLCNMCNLHEIGDEFHFIFKCSYFKKERKKYLNNHYTKTPSIIKFHELFNSTGATLINLCYFIKCIIVCF